MANIAIFRINYKSDFILTLNSDAGWMTPFCIKFWTGAPSQAYFVGYDGTTYTHCAPVAGEPTKLLVQFDDHHLPIGDMKFQIGYHFTVADFPTSVEDEVINQDSVIIEVDDAPAQVMLDLNGETAPEIEFSLPAYANEAQRIANEEQRIAHEAIRIVNEESRIAAETIRQQNEAQRIAQETARVNEFATLKSQSQAATRDANDAAALANEKAALAADKAALAGAAATLANTKAQLAADKAALADAAATLANDKAALAQQKADYAQQQGGYAKDQGDYAKNQGDYAKEQGDTALADHQRAEADHGIAVDDHTQSENDHTRAESHHGIAVDDHTQAGNDHTRAESDHGIAVDDHTQAGNDHTRAESDHGIAADDHTQAGNDHTRAESDHTRAESDHAAVEVYVDSLGAFDISAYHATGGVLAKYADLTAALGTNGANIPEALRKGGMSVKFVHSSVHSSDHKYAQYRLTSKTFSTVVTNWLRVGVDEMKLDKITKSREAFVSGLDSNHYSYEADSSGIYLTKFYLYVRGGIELSINNLKGLKTAIGQADYDIAPSGANSIKIGNRRKLVIRNLNLVILDYADWDLTDRVLLAVNEGVIKGGELTCASLADKAIPGRKIADEAIIKEKLGKDVVDIIDAPQMQLNATTKVISLSEETNYGGWININSQSGWEDRSQNGHYMLHIAPNTEYIITLPSTANKKTYYAFLSERPTYEGTRPLTYPAFVEGVSDKTVINIGQTLIIKSPIDAAYLYIEKTDSMDTVPAIIQGNGVVESIKEIGECVPNRADVTYICHRGNSAVDCPENSIHSITNAYFQGQKYVECDVRKTSDNIYVIMHDTSINRTLNTVEDVDISQDPEILVSSLTWQQLHDGYIYKTNVQKYKTPVTSFGEWLNRVVELNLIPMFHSLPTALLPTVKKRIGERFIYMGRLDGCLAIRKEAPKCYIMYQYSQYESNNSITDINGLIGEMKRIGGKVGYSSMTLEIFTDDVVRALSENGFDFQYSTEGSQYIAYAISKGAKFILANNLCNYALTYHNIYRMKDDLSNITFSQTENGMPKYNTSETLELTVEPSGQNVRAIITLNGEIRVSVGGTRHVINNYGAFRTFCIGLNCLSSELTFNISFASTTLIKDIVIQSN